MPFLAIPGRHITPAEAMEAALAGLLDQLFLLLLLGVFGAIIFGIPYYFYTQFWNKASIDARFSALISLLVLALGIIIGRATKKNKNK